MSSQTYTLQPFRFEVYLDAAPLSGGSGGSAPADGAFAECTGLEATMEPKVIKAGGVNWGPIQRVGQVSFATVVLKRGISRRGQLYQWFYRVASGDYGYRCRVQITLKGPAQAGSTASEPVMTWTLNKALPVKFKAADFNAKATEVGIEELHLVHEGLSFRLGGPEGTGSGASA